MKNLLKPFLVIAVAILTFSCSPEDTIENVEDQTKRGEFLGDDGQTPENTYVTAFMQGIESPDDSICNRGRTRDFVEQVIIVQRGVLNSDPALNPELIVTVGLQQGNSSWGTVNVHIPANDLDSETVLMNSRFDQVILSDNELSNAHPTIPGSSALNLSNQINLKILGIRSYVSGVDTSNYYPQDSSGFAGGCQ